VYLNGTALEHQAQVPLVAGLNRIVVSSLSSKMNRETLEVQLGEAAELLSVGEDEDEYGRALAAKPLYQTAVDSLARIEAEVRTAEAELLGMQQEKAFLLANQTLPAGTQANWSAEVQKGAALMRTRLPAIQREANQLQIRLQGLQAQASQLRPRAAEMASWGSRQVLLVRAARPVTVPLVVRYYVASRAPWWSTLDIRADGAGRKLEFVTHGRLRNQSGLDWQQVRVVLMRQELGENISRPTLRPWELGFGSGDNTGEGRIDAFVVKGTAKGRPADVAQSTSYEVPERVSLVSGRQRDLTLPAVSLPARPEYVAIPRLSEHVFLQAKVAGWEGLQLPESAKVYHQGVYVGETELNDHAYNDSLEVSLGHDELLVVGRAKLEDLSSNVPLTDKRRVHLTYELNVRNRHPGPVRLRLLDEVPISEEKEISVKVGEISGAQLDERTGKLTWLLTVPAGESRKLTFSFQVDYPKDRKVDIINHKVHISSPKFR
jgi:hypothetical protein